MRKTVVTLLAVLFVFSVSVASANVSTVPAGGKADCNRAGWVIENLSETAPTKVHIHIGALAYSWTKNFDRTLEPGGFLSNALERSRYTTSTAFPLPNVSVRTSR